MKLKTLAILAAVLMVGLVAVGPAMADPELDFTIPGNNPGASITFAGGTGNPAVGSGIAITNVQGVDNTPLNNGAFLNISGGVLSFTSGNFTSSTATQWLFGSGGTITITGGISSLGIANGSTLMTGSFESLEITDQGDGQDEITGSVFLDTKNPLLTGYYGLPTYLVYPSQLWPYKGTFNIGFEVETPYTIGGAFTSEYVHSGDVQNRAQPVPEPVTLLLYGLGLTAIGVYRKFRA